jgi:Protein of unknown function (DUF3489)
LGRLEPPPGSCPAGCFIRAGLGWCGGWRRANFRGSHDQTQIQAKGHGPINRPKDRQSRLAQATGSIIKGSCGADTKHARVIAMLRKPAGATIAAIMAVTGWQQHSVRGFLAGVVRKKLGLNLVSDQTDKGRVYRIKEGRASPAAADRAQQAA